MSWAFLAILGYFFHAITSLLDKYLLSSRHIPAPATYAFFVSIFSLFTLFFVPFGFHFPGWYSTVVFLVSGILFLYGLVALYVGIQQSEVSRVSPLAGTVTALTAFLAPFLPGVFQEAVFDPQFLLALILFIGGGLLISFDLPLRKGERVPHYVILAGILIGMHYLLLKHGYGEANFTSGLIWSRLGMFLGGLSLLLVPPFRREIFSRSREAKEKPKRTFLTAVIFVINKTCAGTGTLLITYATFLGSVSLVQALNGVQYVFLLVLAFPLALRYPNIFKEKLSFSDWLQKVLAVILISLGFSLAAGSGIIFF